MSGNISQPRYSVRGANPFSDFPLCAAEGYGLMNGFQSQCVCTSTVLCSEEKLYSGSLMLECLYGTSKLCCCLLSASGRNIITRACFQPKPSHCQICSTDLYKIEVNSWPLWLFSLPLPGIKSLKFSLSSERKSSLVQTSFSVFPRNTRKDLLWPYLFGSDHSWLAII